MEQICGFIDSKGCFHRNEKDCELAEAKYKIRDIERELDKFKEQVGEYLFKHYTHSVYSEYQSHKEIIFNTIAKQVLVNSDAFIQLINRKKELAVHLDILKEDYDRKKITKWWLKFKWW